MIASYCKLQGENKKTDDVFTPWNKDTNGSTEQQTATWIMFLQIHL